jgi:hypothetical protein
MSKLFENFYAKENLKKAFLYLKEEVDESSLSLDPFWKPVIYAIDALGDKYFEALSTYLKQGYYTPEKADYTYVQKDNMGVRPISVLSVTDRIIFQALLNPTTTGDKIDKQLHTFVFGNRIQGKGKYLIPYKKKWGQFCDAQIKAVNDGFTWRIELDIQGFYENILISKLLEILKKEFGLDDTAVLLILKRQLSVWSENTGSGLSIPQGPNASHILANAYLHPVDKLVNSLKGEHEFLFLRYVDDMVIMAKNPDTVEAIVSQMVIFLRQFNLRINEKTKLEKQKNTKYLESLKLYNHYGEINTASSEKVTAIRRKLPKIISKLKKKSDVSKKELGELRYYLKASDGNESDEMINGLIEVLPHKASLIFPISRFIGQFFSNTKENRKQEKDLIIKKYGDKIWKVYNNNQCLTEWSQYWLIKLLFFPEFYFHTPEFEKRVLKIPNHKDCKYLRVVCLFYLFYNSNLNKTTPPFNLDDIKRYISEAKTPAEIAVYYYFLLYLNNPETTPVINEMVVSGLSEHSSVDIGTICLYITRILSLKVTPQNDFSYFTKVFLGVKNEEVKQKQVDYPTHLTFEGKIASNQFANFLGILNQPKKHRAKKIQKSNTYNKTVRMEKSVGKLGYRNDGLIIFGDSPIEMEAQLKDLCRLFIDRPNVLITSDDIKDTIITANRREHTSNNTISKYISKLRGALRPYYKEDVLRVQKKEGWKFVPPHNK